MLVVTDERDADLSYVEVLRSGSYLAVVVSSPLEMTAAARETAFDIAVIDSALGETGLAMVEQLSTLPKRPRMVAVTSRPANGAPLEWFFDFYLVKPCTPGFVVDAVRSIELPPERARDLLIISRDRVGIYDVLERFGRGVADVEIRLDLRRGDRRRMTRRRSPEERRRAERRAIDISLQLRSDGWAFVPAANRV